MKIRTLDRSHSAAVSGRLAQSMRIEYSMPLGQHARVPGRILRLMSDERLVEQLRAGHDHAFTVLFDRHQRGVLSFCRHMLGSADDAEDAAQHTFLAAYGAIRSSHGPTAVRPWLFTIARNDCLSRLRRRRELPVAGVVAVRVGDAAADAETREDLRAVLADVGRLPVDQREALVLAQLGGLSHADIAQILGCTQEKVKALIFQGRSSLIAGRVARETPCSEIRAQLATARGSELRRRTLRRHLRDCPGCQDFDQEVRSQRRRLGAVLPVGHSLELKQAVLAGTVGSGGAAATGAPVGAGLLGGLAAKTLVMAAAATGGTITATVGLAGHDWRGPAAIRASSPTAQVGQGKPPTARNTGGGSRSAAADRGSLWSALADPEVSGGDVNDDRAGALAGERPRTSSQMTPATGAHGIEPARPVEPARPATAEEPRPEPTPDGADGAGPGSKRGDPTSGGRGGRPGTLGGVPNRPAGPPKKKGSATPTHGRRPSPPARQPSPNGRGQQNRATPPASDAPGPAPSGGSSGSSPHNGPSGPEGGSGPPGGAGSPGGSGPPGGAGSRGGPGASGGTGQPGGGGKGNGRGGPGE